MNRRILSLQQISQNYNKLAASYDRSLWLFYLLGFRIPVYRKAAVEQLRLQPGDTVVDLGCGTGLNFEYLQQKVGPQGRIIGVDLSEDMLKQARQRAESKGWGNVTLEHHNFESFQLPAGVDGILSTLALTMSPEYDRVIKGMARALSPGKRMAVFELKRPEQWPDWLVQVMVFLLSAYGTRSGHTQRKPWLSIQKHFSNYSYEEFYAGAVYIASGTA